MQQTEKRKFSIIESSDTFSPEALNDNTRKVEAALVEADDRFNEANTRLTRAVERLDAENLWVKVGAAQGGDASTALTFGLSELDMSKYGALLLMFSGFNRNVAFKLLINGQNIGELLDSKYSGGAIVWFFPCGVHTAISFHRFGYMHGADAHGTVYPDIPWASLQSIGTNQNTPDSYMALYALKA